MMSPAPAPASPDPAVTTTGLPKRARLQDVQDPIPAHAVARTRPQRQQKAQDLATLCAKIARDNRARDVVLLDLRGSTPLIDFFVIATATSKRQAYAIFDEIDREMKRIGEIKLGVEGAEESRWILIDFGDFVVHAMTEEARDYYRLEEIWGDAPRVELPVPDPAPPARPVVAPEDDTE